MENKIWFTSDLHLGHQKEFLWGPRGFNSSLEHDETIIQNWNSVVDYEDDVYILGDLMLEDNEYGIKCINRLAGNIHIILGNHDTESRITLYLEQCPNVIEITYAKELKIGKNYFFLCHYPTCVGNFDDNKKIWCLCGHSHTKDKFVDMDKKSYHVELDCQNNYPIEINEIIKDIRRFKNENSNENNSIRI